MCACGIMADNLIALAPQILEFFDISDDEEEVLNFLKLKFRDSTSKRVCIKNYVESVVPMYSDKTFKSHFRLERSTFEILMGKIQPHYESNTGRPSMPIQKALLSYIWLLANQESFRSVADRFDLAKSTLFRILKSISEILSVMAKKIIMWPFSSFSEVEQNFKDACGFPDVVGAIDGSHIPINKPAKDPEKYYNRKKFFSVVLQAVATPDLCFTDVFCSYPGAVHDSRVFQNSEVGVQMVGNAQYFPQHMHLIGDAAYQLQVNVMVPYKNNGHLSDRQKNYNKALSKTRVCIERAFGQLKGRFRRLKHFDVIRLEYLPLYVLAACVLHNICIRQGDFVDTEDIRNDDDDNDEEDLEDSLTALNKRDYICGILPNVN